MTGVLALTVGDMVERAGLSEQWALMCGVENAPSGSPMMTERAVRAFGRGQVSVRFVADVLDQDVETTTADLVSAGWIEPAAH